MKAKLFAVVAMSVLLLSVAMPVLAVEDGSVSMWVSRVRLNYIGRSYSCPDRVMGLVYLRDDGSGYFGSATVTVEWTLPDGTALPQMAMTPYRGGIARFTVWAGPGQYKLCVTNVTDGTKMARVYDPELNIQNCIIYSVP
jgi:hypothetical protein